MKTTLFDLIWKLKRALEKEGHKPIDLHKFTEDSEYRRTILLNADSSQFQFSAGIRAIYKDLLTDEALDLTKEIDLQQAAVDDPDKFVAANTGPASPAEVNVTSEAKGRNRIVAGLMALILLVALVSGWQYFQLSERGAAEPQGMASNQVDGRVAAEKTIFKEQVLFRLHGSNTIGETLAPELLKAFLTDQGAEDIQLRTTAIDVENNLLFHMPGDNVISRIEMQAHGSSTGFRSLDQGAADLAMASRRIKEVENEQLSGRYGDLRSKGTEHIIGMDGLAVIVNPANPVSHLSTAQLAMLFSGTVDNWSAFGGPDLPVRVYARDANSGTWDSFKSMVLKKHHKTLAATAERIESSIELSDQVSKEPGAIGFIGLPYILRAKALAISDESNAQPIYPTSFTISTEDYPLVRRLYMYEPATVATGSVIDQFIRFVLSEKGQDVVKEAGFISQNVYKTRPVLSSQLPAEYRQLTQNAERLSLNFRFHSGTIVLDNKAQRDLDRVVKYFEDHPGQSAILVGFSDSIGEPAANRQISQQRAEAVEQALLARGINVQFVEGMGEAVPIASNITRAGRQRNRRVEIWVRSPDAVAGY
ncbi:phosphate ABC transporter substrate-binding protein, PhoT family [Amphritea atlantica]|uniref:Phosphate ABC transporter substrate-binding protein, PhoT family n=1 Tax=Amphritea atlantica TaxID=355243 RepID=A0A1H9HIV2_9GAMM|nr:phosphate ABC transporter substrate-binding/OmpA family protein [Amphritea atlantica]SEQ62176.1 phosphate ABC transporter substrate-binding protein, PhoT family [Amphritea atlantica]